MQSLFTVSESISTVAAPAKPSKTTSNFLFSAKIKKVSRVFEVSRWHLCISKVYRIRKLYDTDCGIKEPPNQVAPII